MGEPQDTVTGTDRPTVPFDHHSRDYREHWPSLYADMRSRCPVSWSEHYGGFWVPTTYDDISTVAKDENIFSSDYDVEGVRRGYQGTNIPRPSDHRVFPMEA